MSDEHDTFRADCIEMDRLRAEAARERDAELTALRERLAAAEVEVSRLQAVEAAAKAVAHVPAEETEELIAQAMWTHDDWSPHTLAEADASNLAKVRAGAQIYRNRARAVLAALGGGR